ncbi:C40 family peptidase [Boudabousia marimammalium]|uniref:NlpC/P60 domain-containing protein n=1 Tax=Boudabousia marimammalium TaxID=156892 RepID=A0A1Q5PL62_9ACTO|nr:C40 family peptidase [Boudabousia marimammalium]OKL47372.1 hypothetical protein BM477_06820 [Boudabousia marimammalium]
MQRTTHTARRATRRPATPQRNRPLAATSLGVALGVAVAAPMVTPAEAAPTDGSGPVVDVSSLADQARTALSVNVPIVVPVEADWGSPSVEIEVKKFDARAARRAKAEEEAAKRREEAQRRAAERAERRAASRDSSREAVDSGPIAAPNGSVAAIAQQYIGVPYRWGGTTPGGGFDCSGFTAYVYRQVGINLPHQSTAQMRMGRRVSAAEARPGDLIWHPGHVGIYLGNGQMIHAPRPGKSVTIIPVSYNGRNQYYRMG